MPRPPLLRAVSLVLALVSLVHCSGGDPVATSDLAPQNRGPRIVWDLGRRPFPEIPLPNDLATRVDPASPTGIRLDVSLVAPTAFERSLRGQIDELDGWGTFMPISLAFDDDLDLADLARRHQGDGYDFRDDAVYLVNLDTGLPVPLDVGNGHFPLTVRNEAGFFPNDPRAGGSNLLLATVDEDTNGDGVLQPSEDTNFDGVMQRASVFPRGARPENALTTYWEAESRSLIVRPAVPLDERTQYAVVITDRLRGASGPVRSPFDTLAHPTQLPAMRRLQQHLANPELSRRFYGGLQWSAAPDGGVSDGGRVAFAWTFRTQTTVTDMVDVYRGLHGDGRFATLASVQPAFTVFPARGGNGCSPDQLHNLFIVPATELQATLRLLLPMLGFAGAQGDALVASYDWVDYVAIAHVRSPYLLGDPASPDPDARWHLDALADTMGTDDVQVWIFVPRAQPGATAPFPVAFNAHGYTGGALESIGFAGYFARFGIATLAANAPGHGNPLTHAQQLALRTVLNGRCLGPFGTAVNAGRARDLNGDGETDSGADFLSAHIFHTRDMVRQTALDYMQLIRTITDPSWSQPGSVDYNGDGRPDAPGDLNGDGVVDVGGTRDGATTPIFMWGESLGGITSMVLGGLDPNITAVAPVSGGAGLTDVTLRSNVDGIAGAVLAPTMGPMLVTVAASTRGPLNNRTRTACHANQASLRWVLPDANNVGELEITCLEQGAQGQLQADDDWVVYDYSTGTERCARVPRDAHLFLPVAADAADRLAITVYAGHAITDFGTCARSADAPLRTQIVHYDVGEGDCDDGCGHVPPNAPATAPARQHPIGRGTVLSAPTAGLGLKRQTGAFRRFIQLAQAGIDAGDPVNFAPLFFLRPRTANAHPILAMTTVGDPDVPVATGNTFARAAGLTPFVFPATGSTLDDFTAPDFIWNRYRATPDTVLVRNFVLEGIAELARFPVPMGRNYLFDPDDLDDGRQPFGEATLDPPLRLVRAASAVRPASAPALVDPDTASAQIRSTWQPAAGQPLASFVNAYVLPEGTHTFLPSDPSQPWDSGAYLNNLIARFFQSRGTDVRFYTDPRGHQCLERGTCAFMPQTPPSH